MLVREALSVNTAANENGFAQLGFGKIAVGFPP